MSELETISIKEAAEMAGGNEQILQEMMIKIRQWIQQQLHLPQEISDQRLQCTLLCSKFNLEKAKERLDSLCTLRNLIPEIFADYDPLSDSISRFHKSAQYVYLPKLTPGKYRVSVARYVSNDTSMFYVQDIWKYYFMSMDVRTEEDRANCDLILFDCKLLTLSHILKYTPSLVKKFDLCAEAYGSRLKGVYMINTPTYVEKLMMIFKRFMTPKLFNRLHILAAGVESLYEAIPKSILPIDYGGDELSVDTLSDMWRTKLIERRDWLLEQEKLKTNENLRANSIITPDDLFGVAGTFHKMDID